MTEEYAGFLFDESRTMGQAEYIAFPTCEEELRQVIAWCNENSVPLTTQGGMTGLAGGASPSCGLALNLSRMNKILGIRKDDQGNWQPTEKIWYVIHYQLGDTIMKEFGRFACGTNG